MCTFSEAHSFPLENVSVATAVTASFVRVGKVNVEGVKVEKVTGKIALHLVDLVKALFSYRVLPFPEYYLPRYL